MPRMTLRKNGARALRKIANRLDRPAPAPAPAQSRPDTSGPRSTSAPGSRTASMFFRDYPRFFETSETSARDNRLNLRYEAIFAENRDVFDGARVLDIASHDGRWSLAALACGAESVIGIEARADLVESAGANLAHYGYAPERFRFLAGDVNEVLNEQDFDVDVVLCLGYLYHTLRYNELMHGIRKADPRHLIIDTVAEPMRGGQPAVWLHQEKISWQGNAVADRYSHGRSVVIGRPNLKAIRLLADGYGFKVERLSDWGGLLRDNPELCGPGVTDYTNGTRVTIRCVDKAHARAASVAD